MPEQVKTYYDATEKIGDMKPIPKRIRGRNLDPAQGSGNKIFGDNNTGPGPIDQNKTGKVEKQINPGLFQELFFSTEKHEKVQGDTPDGTPPQRRHLIPKPKDFLVGCLINKGIREGPDGQA